MRDVRYDMPQIHHVSSYNEAQRTLIKKFARAHDDESRISASHLIIEAHLHTFIRKKIASPQYIQRANLSFYQALHVARSLRRNFKNEIWLWETIEELNKIRNRIAHDIFVQDLDSRLKKLYDTADYHITIYHDSDDPRKREENRVTIFLTILCTVTRQYLIKEKRTKH